MIHSLKNLLNRKLRATGGGTGRRIQAAVIVAAVEAAIAAEYPAGSGIRAATFRDGIVSISCDRAVDAQEIKLRESEILAEASRRLGAGTVKKLRVTC